MQTSSIMADIARDMESMLSANARKILDARYLHGESIEVWLSRIAMTIASPQDDNVSLAHEYARAIGELRFMPNTPCLANAGRNMGQLSACFVLPISDDLCVAEHSIFRTLRDASAIQQTGGGVGFDWSDLRPCGSIVASSGGVSSGPISFLRIYDAAFDGIKQGGMRRGACMAVLRVDHPDIEKFIKCKKQEKSITNFNISIAITDAFMEAVFRDEMFALRNPRDGNIERSVRAQDLMNHIAEGAWRNGEPGVIFIDEINRTNPVPHLYRICATNPCGEQALGPYENCALGHINLARMLHNGSIDAKLIAKTVSTAITFLDQMIDRNTYVPTVPKLRESALKSRRIGLGITGLADLYLDLGIKYGSIESTALASFIMLFIRMNAITRSCALARELGAFPAIEGSIWDRNNIESTMRPLIIAVRDTELMKDNNIIGAFVAQAFGDIRANLRELMDNLSKYGVRNACMLSIAPTGTTSMILGTLGYGCEPIYSHAYSRVTGDGTTMQFCSETIIHKIANIYAQMSAEGRLKYSEKKIIECIMRGDMTKLFVDLATTDPRCVHQLGVINATALNISPIEHLYVQEALQRYVDNGISKTVNCPHDTSIADIRAIYTRAYEMKLKGVAIYRNGSRETEVLVARETGTVAREAGTVAREAGTVARETGTVAREADLKRPRPLTLHGLTYRGETAFGRVHTTVDYLDGDPFEVFINVGKSGTEVYADSEAIGRLISTILRMKSDISADKRMEEIIDQLRGIGGSRSMRDPLSKRSVSSLPDAVALALETIRAEHGTDVVPTIHRARDICPSCHTANMLRVERCQRCEKCGYSQC